MYFKIVYVDVVNVIQLENKQPFLNNIETYYYKTNFEDNWFIWWLMLIRTKKQSDIHSQFSYK